MGEVIHMGELINIENVNFLLWAGKAFLKCVVEVGLNGGRWEVKNTGGVLRKFWQRGKCWELPEWAW